jgi:DNA-binding NarL/FixJ family response regulator
MMIAGQLAVALENAQLYKEVGIRLGLAEITVKSHLTAIFRLLGVVNRTQAVVTMRKLGLDYTASLGERSPAPPSPSRSAQH